MIVLFPGKFQPPHLGHIVTILKIYDTYDKIIIGITEDTPSIMDTQEVKEILETVFQHLPKIKVVIIKGVLCTRLSPEGLPAFDAILTGNPLVIQWAKQHNLTSMLIPRSKGLGFSGTSIRKSLENSP